MELYNLEALREEKRLIEEFCRQQIAQLDQLNRKIQNSQWHDPNKDKLLEYMKDFTAALNDTLNVLCRTDGNAVMGTCFFDKLIPRLEAYVSTASTFDKID